MLREEKIMFLKKKKKLAGAEESLKRFRRFSGTPPGYRFVYALDVYKYLPKSPKIWWNVIAAVHILCINNTKNLNLWNVSKTLVSQAFSISGTSVYILYASWIILQKSPWKTLANCSPKWLCTVALALYNPFAGLFPLWEIRKVLLGFVGIYY